MAKRDDLQILSDLQDVENALSPENLCCDGELPKAQVERKRKELLRQRIALVSELGREPKQEELYPEIYR